MGISRALRSRVESDAKSPAYWYVPKGQAVYPENWPRIAEHLRILAKFERVAWSDAQPEFAKELLDKGMIEPYRDPREGFSAVARMQFPVWRLLGLAWINEGNEPEITDVGRSFSRARTVKERRDILTSQLHRYQFHNPCLPSHFGSFRTFPILAIYRLLSQTDWHLTWNEFLLFGTRTRSFQDADELALHVDEWRSLDNIEKEQLLAVAQTISADSNTKSEEGTTWGKVWRDWAYERAVLRILPTLALTSEDVLSVPKEAQKRVNKIVLDAAGTAEFVEYEAEQDWLAFYGQGSKLTQLDGSWSRASDARSYYERIGRVDAAAIAFAREGRRSQKQLDEYKSVQILEKTLEDLLEHNLEQLESGLVLLYRQFKTPIGTIDLLAKDANGLHVVVELKRGSTSDEVVGQIARYLGWVANRLAAGKQRNVRGMIVGKDFDKKFSSAITRLKGITPYTFDLLVKVEPWPTGRKSK